MAVVLREDSYSSNIVIDTGGQTFQATYEYKVDFDSTQWHVNGFSVRLSADQNYVPNVFGVVKGSFTADYAGRGIGGEVTWGIIDNAQTKSVFQQVTGINYAAPGETIKIKVVYRLPTTGVGTHVMNFTLQTTVNLFSTVTNPTNTPPPTLPPPKVIDTGQPAPFKWPWELWDTNTKLIVAGAAGLTLLLIVRPSAPATIISSGYRAYRGRNRRR